METLPAKTPNNSEIERVLIHGDISGLTEDQRLQYAKAVCDSVGLNLLTKPFEFMKLNGKMVLYATKGATDQLRKINSISTKISRCEKIEDIYVVTCCGTTKDGRTDEATGAVNIKGMGGEALANAMLKAETKAKRRMTLSICGLGLLDESEARDVTPELQATTRQVDAQIENLTERPEFEAFIESKHGVSETYPESTPDGAYIFKTGGTRKGKPVSAFSVDRLNEFMAQVDKMKDPTDDVILDYNAAQEYVAEKSERD